MSGTATKRKSSNRAPRTASLPHFNLLVLASDGFEGGNVNGFVEITRCIQRIDYLRDVSYHQGIYDRSKNTFYRVYQRYTKYKIITVHKYT